MLVHFGQAMDRKLKYVSFISVNLKVLRKLRLTLISQSMDRSMDAWMHGYMVGLLAGRVDRRKR